jgi:hypothetical protein
MEEDIDIDDIFQKKPKKIKSGKKGKRVELELVKSLNERFSQVLASNLDGGKFSRSIGSGNRWGQNVHLSRAATSLYSGDIVCPERFKFVLESKGGYNDIDLCSAFEEGQSELDEFLKQVSSDSERCKRKPLLFWKKDRKPRIAFIRSEDLGNVSFEYVMKYREWTAVSYKDLMSLDDGFFFN